jgi:leucyl-tRNA synthetase family protein
MAAVDSKIEEKRGSTRKLDELRSLEASCQSFWERERLHETDADADADQKQKFMTTFPYPYMNGRLHVGHTFTLSKCDFAAGYQRRKGKKVLFPFAFHVTGMPIAACADKLKRELEAGVPEKLAKAKAMQPEFVVRSDSAVERARTAQKEAQRSASAAPKGTKGKSRASGAAKEAEALLKQCEAMLEKVRAPHSTGGIVARMAEQIGVLAQNAECAAECAADASAAAVEEKKSGGAKKSDASGAVAASSSLSSSSSSRDFGAKKTKLAVKQGDATCQWEIMQMMDLPDELISKFVDTRFWLDYFPPEAKQDLRALGAPIDWRRSFLTTPANPYYDRFVQWQFNSLRKLDKFTFGKRFTIWSPREDQPCADHDRASGENVKPNEYTGIKLELVAPFRRSDGADGEQEDANPLDALEGRRIYLIAATLRPETMVGQTNCWVHPDSEYGAFEINERDVFVMSARAAYNLSFQSNDEIEAHQFGEYGKPKQLATVSGAQLIGLRARAPMSVHETVRVLPMLIVLPNVGTGIVTSVPSDAPADFAALEDLRRKPDLRAKYGVDEVWLLDEVPIIDIPELGDRCARTVVERMGITSQNDPRLEAAKEECYKLGFARGKLCAGPHAGRAVDEAKPLVRQSMIDSGDAIPYAEPQSPVTSRSGDECVVCLTDQWQLLYGEPEWRARAERALANMRTFGDATRQAFVRAFDWLGQWPCSRTYGLGTAIPWDDRYIIESLSDSTLYNAYYTVAHLLQGGNLFGAAGDAPGTLGVRAEQMTDEAFDYVFERSDVAPDEASGAPPRDALDRMRAEFAFWYPTDMRVSGKDLILNHLTFYLYNHTALLPERRWPAGVRCNGHVMLDGEKMSKSKGNFLTLAGGLRLFGADALRFELASSSGDGLDDANFETSSAEKNILRLHTMLRFYAIMAASSSASEPASSSSGADDKPSYMNLADSELVELRAAGSPPLFRDRVFVAQLDCAVRAIDAAYGETSYRSVAVQLFELIGARDTYRMSTADIGMHRGVIDAFMRAFAIMLSPLCPHVAEQLWQMLHGRTVARLDAEFAGDAARGLSVLEQRWPRTGQFADVADDATIDELLRQHEYIEAARADFVHRAQLAAKMAGRKKQPLPDRVAVIVAIEFPEQQRRIIEAITELADDDQIESVDCKTFAQVLGARSDPLLGNKKQRGRVMAFAKQTCDAYAANGRPALALTAAFDETELLRNSMFYILSGFAAKRELAMDIELQANSTHRQAEQAAPSKPAIAFFVSE